MPVSVSMGEDLTSSCRKRRVSTTSLPKLVCSPPPAEQKETSRVQQMIHQEQTSRATSDYIALQQADPSMTQNHLWRERVSKWSYDVLDYLEESRDVAHVAMDILDRYLAVLATENSRGVGSLQPFEFEVMAFTALFLAIRVSGKNRDLQIPELLQLSSSGAEPRHILEAGHHMLEKLCWDHRILTPHSFLKEFLRRFVTASNEQQQHRFSKDHVSSLLDFASYLVEVSVCDAYFSPCAPSHVAVGALVVAMTCDETLASDAAHRAFVAQFFRHIQEHVGINIESAAMKAIISRLLDVYNQSHEAASSSSSCNQQGTNSSSSNNSPHIIMDDEMDHDCKLASSMAQGVMAMEEIRSVSPASLDRIHASSGIFQVAE
ncbi:MAG: hypothetical protein SGILL_004047 [Bacillariaceae sp.]